MSELATEICITNEANKAPPPLVRLGLAAQVAGACLLFKMYPSPVMISEAFKTGEL